MNHLITFMLMLIFIMPAQKTHAEISDLNKLIACDGQEYYTFRTAFKQRCDTELSNACISINVCTDARKCKSRPVDTKAGCHDFRDCLYKKHMNQLKSLGNARHAKNIDELNESELAKDAGERFLCFYKWDEGKSGTETNGSCVYQLKAANEESNEKPSTRKLLTGKGLTRTDATILDRGCPGLKKSAFSIDISGITTWSDPEFTCGHITSKYQQVLQTCQSVLETFNLKCPSKNGTLKIDNELLNCAKDVSL